MVPNISCLFPTVRDKIDHWWSNEFVGIVLINPAKLSKGFSEQLKVMGMDGPSVITSSLKIFKIRSAARPEGKQF